jgi:hypothetical protein
MTASRAPAWQCEEPRNSRTFDKVSRTMRWTQGSKRFNAGDEVIGENEP